jgi:hypothetical protein
MATTKGRKTTAKSRKKKTEEVVEAPVVESPVEEVIEPVVEAEPAQEELPSAPVQEEAVAVEPAPEPVVEEKVEAAPEPVVEEKAPPPPPPAPEPKVEEPAPAPAAQPRVIGIGSEVVMPSGKRGKVVGLSPKGRFQVSKLSNPRKVYLYLPQQLSLVK